MTTRDAEGGRFIKAPFTPEQVYYLNKSQYNEMVHPFTCGGGRENPPHYDEGILIATKYGWICPACDYKQDWVHDFMARKSSWNTPSTHQPEKGEGA